VVEPFHISQCIHVPHYAASSTPYRCIVRMCSRFRSGVLYCLAEATFLVSAVPQVWCLIARGIRRDMRLHKRHKKNKKKTDIHELHCANTATRTAWSLLLPLTADLRNLTGHMNWSRPESGVSRSQIRSAGAEQSSSATLLQMQNCHIEYRTCHLLRSNGPKNHSGL
jgi:hypothetical protein